MTPSPASTSVAASTASWFRQIGDRIAYLWPLKAVGTTAFMALFFWGYFSVLRHPLFAAVEMPLTPVDRWVPFTPLAMPAYASLWVYASLPPAFLRQFATLIRFGLWIAGLCLFCLGIFWLWPTLVPSPGIDWRLYPEMTIIKSMDRGGNACPSLHVAAAVFSALWLARVLREVGAPRPVHWGNWAICWAILWSTMATRQHVFLDVVAGAVVGLVFARASLRHALARGTGI